MPSRRVVPVLLLLAVWAAADDVDGNAQAFFETNSVAGNNTGPGPLVDVAHPAQGGGADDL
jgi:hypothetical protein